MREEGERRARGRRCECGLTGLGVKDQQRVRERRWGRGFHEDVGVNRLYRIIEPNPSIDLSLS